MPLIDPAYWSEYLRQTLQCYEVSLLRDVAAQLLKPRNQWPVAELIDRCVAVTTNTALIDRRLSELDAPERQLLALIGHSRQPRWNLGNLVELLMALGHAEGLPTVLKLFEQGLLYPDLPAVKVPRLKSFEQWVGQSAEAGPQVFAHPLVAVRAIGEELGLPECPATAPADASASSEVGRIGNPSHTAIPAVIHEADGLELPLRMAALWQQVLAAPLRRTAQGDFFKRDWERLSQDPLLNAAAAESLVPLPDPGMLTVALAEIEGVIQADESELRAAGLPSAWEEGLEATLASLWAALFRLNTWDAAEGWHGTTARRGNPYPSAYLLTLLLLARLSEDKWVHPADVERWITGRHPFWRNAVQSDRELRIEERGSRDRRKPPDRRSILHFHVPAGSCLSTPHGPGRQERARGLAGPPLTGGR